MAPTWTKHDVFLDLFYIFYKFELIKTHS